MNFTNYEILLKDKATVFDTTDLRLLWGYAGDDKASELARYYTNKNKLFRLRQGLYSVVDNPDPYLVSQKLLCPSYISFYTALRHHGIIFQWYETVFSAALHPKMIRIGEQGYQYNQLKASVLFNPLGIEQHKGYNMASIERAICDTLYIFPNASFDNLRSVDPDKLVAIAKIYNSPKLYKSLSIYFSEFFLWVKLT
jgi:predicted transcriptional regulator of viral defense system